MTPHKHPYDDPLRPDSDDEFEARLKALAPKPSRWAALLDPCNWLVAFCVAILAGVVYIAMRGY